MEFLPILVYLAIPILAIAWLLGWRRENREQLKDVQERLARIEASQGIR